MSIAWNTSDARWATFDCYGTLIDWRGGISGVFRRLWPSSDAQTLLDAYNVVEPVVQALGNLTYRDVQARALRAVAAIGGLSLSSNDDFALAESLPNWPAFADVKPALLELQRQGWRLAILSNTDPDLLAGSLKQIDVEVDLAITAREAGSYKPAPGHWRAFLDRTGARQAHHVHVAASLFHDIEPASILGIQSVWINRLDESSPLPRNAELRDLREL